MGEPAESARRLSDQEARLAVAAARRYYLEDHSKIEIAAELGLSRFKVARLLSRARAEGLVTISIAEPDAGESGMSRALAEMLGVSRVIVADVKDSRTALDVVGATTASYLRSVVTADSILGIAWSRAVRALSEHFDGIAPCTVLQLCGVLPQPGVEEHNVEIVRNAARACGGTAVTFYAPLVLPAAATAAALRQERTIAQALARCDELSVAVISIGAWRAEASSVYDALEPAECAAFARRGVVAESSGLLFDAAGNVLQDGLQSRSVAVSERQLRNAPEVIALASEPERTDAVRAITRSGLVTTLVTHTAVATRLLHHR